MKGAGCSAFARASRRYRQWVSLGDLYDSEPTQALQLAEVFAWMMSAELLHYGVDLSFAPVLDIGDPVSSVIGDRAFHRDPEAIAHLANAWVRGMRKAGMEAVGKHFPGHGSVEGDSHHVMPFDRRLLTTSKRWIWCRFDALSTRISPV